MVQTKCTPKNPQIHRLVTAIGKDIQPPRKDMPKTPRKGGKQSRKFISHKIQERELNQQEDSRNPIDTDLVWLH